MESHWPVRLFNKSVLKQEKFRQITALLGDTHGLQCLDVGADNGVISYLLRARGGTWKSADLDEQAVRAIRGLVKREVWQIDGRRTPFQDDAFDRVVIIDFLEHIHTDEEFMHELFRIIRPGGEVIINVPHIKQSLLRRFRLWMGQTDERHGHVRQGYTLGELQDLVRERFTIVDSRTYSKFFSECLDTCVTLMLDFLKRGKSRSKKGILVVEEDLHQYQRLFRMYSIIYPVFWLFARLDRLLFRSSGYLLVVRAKVQKGAYSGSAAAAHPDVMTK